MKKIKTIPAKTIEIDVCDLCEEEEAIYTCELCRHKFCPDCQTNVLSDFLSEIYIELRLCKKCGNNKSHYELVKYLPKTDYLTKDIISIADKLKKANLDIKLCLDNVDCNPAFEFKFGKKIIYFDYINNKIVFHNNNDLIKALEKLLQ